MAPRCHRFSNRKKTSAPSVKTVITGGARLIGSDPADALLAEGHEVVVLDNFSTGQRLEFKASHSMREAIETLVRAFDDGLLPDSLEDERYFNIKRMQSLNLK